MNKLFGLSLLSLTLVIFTVSAAAEFTTVGGIRVPVVSAKAKKRAEKRDAHRKADREYRRERFEALSELRQKIYTKAEAELSERDNGVILGKKWLLAYNDLNDTIRKHVDNLNHHDWSLQSRNRYYWSLRDAAGSITLAIVHPKIFGNREKRKKDFLIEFGKHYPRRLPKQIQAN